MEVRLTMEELLVMLFIIALFALFLTIGFIDYKHTNHVKGFVLANRSQGALAVGLSLSATIMGASSTIGMAALVYKVGLPGLWWLLSGVVGLLVLHMFLAKKANMLNVMTLPEAIGKFYGQKARLFTAILIVIAWSGIVAAQFIAAGKVLSVITHYNYSTLVIFSGAFTILYTFVGGQFSVFKTDRIQFLILFVGIASVVGFVVFKFGAPSISKSLLSFPVNEHFGMKKLILFLLVVGLPYAAGPDMYSRIFAAKDPEAAQKGVLITIILILASATLIGIIGIYAHLFAPSGEKILMVMARSALPPVLSYAFIAALLSAIVSSADTCLLSASTILSLDILNTKRVSHIRAMVILIGTISILIALYYGGIIKTLLISYGIYTGSVALPLIVGFFKEKLKIENRYALFAIFFSAVVALVLSVAKNEYAGLASICVSAGLMFMGWLLSSKTKVQPLK